MEAQGCAAFNNNACLCFAAMNGEACAYCATSATCLPVGEAGESCPQQRPEDRRAAAAKCGKTATNLVTEPRNVLPGSVLPAWSGERLEYRFGAVFRVKSVSFQQAQGTTAVLEALPQSATQESELSKPCSSESCVYKPGKFPFIANLTISNAEPGSSLQISSLKVELAPFVPIDGKLTLTEPWSRCSNGCGTGTQTRVLVCSAPEYGGLPCEDELGGPVQGTVNQTRACQGQYACGTNWHVMAIIGWWQVLLVAVFASRKACGAIQARKAASKERALAHRRRFSSDVDTGNMGLSDRLGSESDVNGPFGSEEDDEDVGGAGTSRADAGELDGSFELKLA